MTSRLRPCDSTASCFRFINDLDCGILSSLLKLANDTNLFGIVNSHDDSQILQQDIRKLTDWSYDWQLSFNVDNWKVMHVRRSNMIHSKYNMKDAELGDTSQEKGLGVITADNFWWLTLALCICIFARK